MNDTMNPNRLSLNGVEYEIIFNDKEPVPHTTETLFVWDFPKMGMTREICKDLFNLGSNHFGCVPVFRGDIANNLIEVVFCGL